MSPITPAATGRQHSHRLRPLLGRDPNERHRTATPLELLYDLTFVVAFGTAADHLAHYLTAGHTGTAVTGFLIAVTAVVVAWTDYSWFASAFDNDDWAFRVATMVQMVGVVMVALGSEEMFASIDAGGGLDVHVMVFGYVVMRSSMVLLWWRVARRDAARTAAAASRIWTIGIAQVGWVVLAFSGLSLTPFLIAGAGFLALDVFGPWISQRHKPTPWHAHHIAERHGLLVIITLGEGVLGTVAALNVLVHTDHGWTFDAVLLAVAGIGMTFGMWWMYFTVPWGEVLSRHRERSAFWSLGHIVLFASITATGAGLQAAAAFLEGGSALNRVGAVLTVAVPMTAYIGSFYGLGAVFLRHTNRFHLLLLAVTAGMVLSAIGLAGAGVGMAWCLVVLMMAPMVTVIGHETVGHRHMAEVLRRT
ncbi:low temperature requirement protein A [Streptomyces sp. NPDC001292]|uniref:low temperature requirement protein A n=1 Tax=Streptomyces sp. NPDC001292 TaxID=3364558 RepID=UPI00369DEB7F